MGFRNVEKALVLLKRDWGQGEFITEKFLRTIFSEYSIKISLGGYYEKN